MTIPELQERRAVDLPLQCLLRAPQASVADLSILGVDLDINDPLRARGRVSE